MSSMKPVMNSKNVSTLIDKSKELLKQIIAYCPAMNYLLKDKATFLPWVDIFSELNDKQIQTALKWLKNNYNERDISPARFKFKSFGLYDISEAYELATQRDWKHPIIYWAASQAGMYNTQFKPTSDKEFIKFKRIYDLKCHEAMEGKVYSLPHQLGETNPEQYREKTPEEKKKAKKIQHEVMEKIRQINKESKNKYNNLIKNT